MTSVMEATVARLSELYAHEKEVMPQSCNTVKSWENGYFKRLILKDIVQYAVAIFSFLRADYCYPAPAKILGMWTCLRLGH